jgi:6-pyruvoyltetrahydropterin/6-carboxytetrahydropterin synthase
MLIFVTRRETFNAAHRMYRQEWSAEKNEEVFGKCANRNWHGHNFTLFVTVKGEISDEKAYLIDLRLLKMIIREHVIEKVDHRNLNLDVDFMKGRMATTEMLCAQIYHQLKMPIENHEGVRLHSVRLHETENNSAEYFGQ